MEASTSKSADEAKTSKHARLAEDPPSLPVGAPANLNDHHRDDEGESDAESEFDESTVKTEGGLISKLENLDERTFEDKKKVALRELDDNGNEKPDEDDKVDEATSNAGKCDRASNGIQSRVESNTKSPSHSLALSELLAEFPDDIDVRSFRAESKLCCRSYD